MPLAVPNPNPVGGRPSARSTGRTPRQTPTTPATNTNPTPTFTPTPEYSNVGAWSGWDTKFDAPNQGNAFFQAGKNAIDGVAAGFGRGTTQRDYYTQQYGADMVQQAMQSGLDPQTFFSLGPAAQQQAVQWGTNVPRAADIGAQQRALFDQQQQQTAARNDYVDQFGSLQDLNALNLQQQFLQGSAMAQGRYDMNLDHMTTNVYNDLGVLGQQRFRSVDLARDDNRAALLHNSNMRGVLDTSRGLVGQDFSRQQGFLNDQMGFLNQRQDLAYNQFQSSDRYAGQQSRDLMAQYGFAGRQFAQTQEEAFANRNTQERAAASDAAARGAFSSAGFGDNIQDIRGQYSRSMDANTLQLDRTTQSIDERDREIGNQRDNLRFGYEGQRIGFSQDARGINNAHEVNRIGTEGEYNQLRGQYSANDLQRANLQNVDKGLSSLAKEYGLREADIKNQFEQSVDRMGLDLNETQQQLGQMLASGNAQLIAQANQFMSQMMAYQ
jgi:hypothetical protein